MGNNELCGAPLLKSCPGGKSSHDSHDHVDEIKVEESGIILSFRSTSIRLRDASLVYNESNGLVSVTWT